jgi:hypothetical protein
MPFVAINSADIEVGDPITADLLTQIKDDLDDHEARILAGALVTTSVSIINTVIEIGSTSTLLTTGCLSVEILNNITITEGSLQLFLKSPATTGSITIDIKKNNTTNPTGFNSIFTILPTFNIASASDYQKTTGTINATYQNLIVGDIVRLDLVSIPAGLQKIKVVLMGVS